MPFCVKCEGIVKSADIVPIVMPRDLRITAASVQYEESPAEDPEGPFWAKPCLKFYLSTAFGDASEADPATTSLERYLLSWSVRFILVRTVMRTLAKVWAPDVGVVVPSQQGTLQFQFRLPLSKGAANTLRRRRRAPKVGQLEMRVTALERGIARPVEFVGSFTVYVERIDEANVKFTVGESSSTLQIPERRSP